jgi:DNA-binding transcriptional MerR regulator
VTALPPELDGELSYRQLDHWTTRHPALFSEGARDAGSGHRRTYTPGDITTLRRLAHLTRAGLTLRAAATLPARTPAHGLWLTPHVHLRYRTATPHRHWHRPTLKRPARYSAPPRGH